MLRERTLERRQRITAAGGHEQSAAAEDVPKRALPPELLGTLFAPVEERLRVFQATELDQRLHIVDREARQPGLAHLLGTSGGYERVQPSGSSVGSPKGELQEPEGSRRELERGCAARSLRKLERSFSRRTGVPLATPVCIDESAHGERVSRKRLLPRLLGELECLVDMACRLREVRAVALRLREQDQHVRKRRLVTDRAATVGQLPIVARRLLELLTPHAEDRRGQLRPTHHPLSLERISG